MKTRTWILLLSLVALLLGGALLLQRRSQTPARYAEIRQNGELLRRVDLSEDQTITVRCEVGRNVLVVEDGKIRVSEADCDGGDCVRCGAKNCGAPIICLPHRLEIRFTDDGGIDALAH